MKNRRFKLALASCAAAFSFAAAPAFSQSLPASTPSSPVKTESPKVEASKSPSDPQYEFLVKRIVRLSGVVNRDSVTQVIQKLTTLEEMDSSRDVTLIINSPGGGVVQGLAIIDRIHTMKSKVNTVCEGEAQSMGAVLLAAGTGTRTAHEDCFIMIHQLSGEVRGVLADMQNDMAQSEMLNRRLVEILSNATGVPQQELRRVMLTNFSLTSAEAVSMGLIDSVIPAVQMRKEKAVRSIPAKATERNFPSGRP